MLRSFCDSEKSDWDNHLPYVMMAYQATVQESTWCTPNLLMFGLRVATLRQQHYRLPEFQVLTEWDGTFSNKRAVKYPPVPVHVQQSYHPLVILCQHPETCWYKKSWRLNAMSYYGQRKRLRQRRFYANLTASERRQS